MLNLYPAILDNTLLCAAENKADYLYLTERHVQVMWLEQKYFKPISTSDGESIQVISPGIWNSEAGPDFLKAHLLIGQKDWRGDIEIHLNEDDWVHHGHHKDERYDSVILHLLFWKSKSTKIFNKKNGLPILSACLEDKLTISLSRIVQLIDLDLYPYKKFVGSGKCGRELFKTLPNEKILSFFKSAAFWRLEKKKSYLEDRFGEHKLAGGIAMALGYKHNAESFGDLFSYLLTLRDLPEEELLAISLGCSGFFEERFQNKWGSADYFQHLKTIWEGNKHQITHQSQLRLDHVRPYNHPVRRLAYLVKLLQDPKLEGLWNQIQQVWKQRTKKIYEQLLDAIPSYQHPYWNYRYTFDNTAKGQFLSLIGDNLKTEILVNTVLPLLYSEVKEDYEDFENLYLSIHSMNTSKKKYLIHRFFGDTEKGKLMSNCQMEQGAYQLHKDFCIHFEASCEGCPFVDRYQSSITF